MSRHARSVSVRFRGRTAPDLLDGRNYSNQKEHFEQAIAKHGQRSFGHDREVGDSSG
jgi:hypothetical protein